MPLFCISGPVKRKTVSTNGNGISFLIADGMPFRIREMPMFWIIVSIFAAAAAVVVLWVNASALGVTEKDHMPVPEYEKRLGLGTREKETPE